ncbi:nickel pincer cofactor biosynthesis protein LarB [Veillonella caviae]|uniref:nickel pincer cofactor biosynthesis protein LarB n=1 Tax=Veillonella caviae TaxID=248316 RepID=UPI0023564A04|nr:nickel pincer cofactor biosynthesis protein LarB [Veillonella caviae]
MSESIRNLLEQVKNGQVSVDTALLKLKTKPIDDLGYAQVDLHRVVRQGVPEVIYGAGKTGEQIVGIISSMKANGQCQILITRLSPDIAVYIQKKYEMTFVESAHIGYIGDIPIQKTKSSIAIITGGTSDYKVAEECAVTAEFYGNKVERVYDVGVAGIHRLLQNLERIMSAKVIVVIAGMEGALASVVGGLVDVPVIAVPTSVGYGTSFGGVAALLSMLNSCASGVTVVNIDNGFGAAYMANMINHIGESK